MNNNMPPTQTLREGYYKWYWGDSKPSEDTHLFYASRRTNKEIADFFLPHFSTILEEVIGEDESHALDCGKREYGEGALCDCGADSRNSLRQHQRIIGKDYLK